MNLEDVHAVLRDEDRRAVVRRLANTEETALAIDELVGAVSHSRGGGDERPAEQLRASLHHCHLPKLREYDIVDYDAEENCVRPGPHLSVVATVGAAASTAFSGAGDQAIGRDVATAGPGGEQA